MPLFCSNSLCITATVQERLVKEIRQFLHKLQAERDEVAHREAQLTLLCFRIDLLLLLLFVVIDLSTLFLVFSTQ